MTVIAFDGKTLAADRMANSNGLARTMRKVFTVKGHLLTFAGTAHRGLTVMAWWTAGAKPKDWPPMNDPDDVASLWVVKPDGGIMCYESGPIPLPFLDKTFACGSGRDYAMGAMAMGADAIRAVEIASEYEIHCGGGVDFLTLGETNEPD